MVRPALLSEAAIAQMLELTLGRGTRFGFVAAWQHATGGNPLPDVAGDAYELGATALGNTRASWDRDRISSLR
jgi:hypothetical protein